MAKRQRSKLVIVLPFPASELCDLEQQAQAMRDCFSRSAKGISANNFDKVDEIVIVNRSSDDTYYECTQADKVIVLAHGGANTPDLGNNCVGDQHYEIKVYELVEMLEGMKAQRCGGVWFMCCYGGLPGHVGDVWHKKHLTPTFLSKFEVGNPYLSTRRSIYGVCVALTKAECAE